MKKETVQSKSKTKSCKDNQFPTAFCAFASPVVFAALTPEQDRQRDFCYTQTRYVDVDGAVVGFVRN